MTSALVIVAVLVAVVAALELYVRFALGLGDPPLWQFDPELEYVARPSRSYVRFGNRISYNAYSMRSREFPRQRSDPDEVRVLVVGDSIIDGGAHTDQDALATSILERRLAERLARPVLVGNVAAGSWGPPNQLAYLKRHGLFDADLVVLVVNSADHADAPTFEPLDARRPQRKPVLALQEIAGKYLPRLYRKTFGLKRPKPPITPADIELCLDSFRTIVTMARDANAEVLIAQHLKKSELTEGPERGHGELGAVARDLGLEPIQLGPGFQAALEARREPYHDGNHPNVEGQRVIADVLFEPMVAALERARG